MRAIDLALKDFSQMVRDWKFVFFLLIMPVAFTLLFGFVFGGTRAESDPRLPVAYVDEDHGRFSSALRQALEDSPAIRLEVPKEGDDLEKLVEDADVAAAVIVPAGYSDALLAGTPMKLVVITDPAANAGMTVQNELRTGVNRLLNALRTAWISVQVCEEEESFSGEIARQEYFDAAVALALEAWQNPPTQVKVEEAVVEQEEEPYSDNPYAHPSPGMMVQFSIAGLIGAAEVLVLERKTRSLQRLLTTAISRGEILAGHFLTMFSMIFLQLLILTVFGQIFLGLGYYRDLLAILLLMTLTALCTGSMGLLIGTLAKNEDQVIVMTLVPMFVLAGLGGAWVPIEFMPESVQVIGHLLPAAWIMDGFKGLLIRGWGLAEIWQPLGALLGFTVIFGGLALWRFRFE